MKPSQQTMLAKLLWLSSTEFLQRNALTLSVSCYLVTGIGLLIPQGSQPAASRSCLPLSAEPDLSSGERS